MKLLKEKRRVINYQLVVLLKEFVSRMDLKKIKYQFWILSIYLEKENRGRGAKLMGQLKFLIRLGKEISSKIFSM